MGTRVDTRPARPIKADPNKVLKEYAEASGGETEIALPREILTGRDFSFDRAPRLLRSFLALK